MAKFKLLFSVSKRWLTDPATRGPSLRAKLQPLLLRWWMSSRVYSSWALRVTLEQKLGEVIFSREYPATSLVTQSHTLVSDVRGFFMSKAFSKNILHVLKCQLGGKRHANV